MKNSSIEEKRHFAKQDLGDLQRYTSMFEEMLWSLEFDKYEDCLLWEKKIKDFTPRILKILANRI